MLIPLTELWLPILLSAVAVFIASSVIHMLIGWHNHDFAKLANEDEVMDALRKGSPEPGDYVFPRADDPADFGAEEIQKKWAEGPAGRLTVFPAGPVNMGKQLVHWFFYCVAISIFAGYLGAATLGAGTNYLNVFQVVGCAAFLGYAGSMWQQVIWWGAKPLAAIKSIVDGLVYALFTAGVFGWLWP
jgi:hypothetical protein